jgi:polar amino acid transport system substrate-binding protein
MSRSLPPTARRPILAAVTGLAVATLSTLTACSPQDSAGTTPASTTSSATSAGSSSAGSLSAACAKDALTIRTAGKLTVGTDKPAFEPWFSKNDPTNGKGYESAVAYAVAGKLGFAQAEVTWTVASFSSVIQPGPKAFDFDINQVSITDERKKNIDFSSGYYDVTQSVVTVKGSKAAAVKTLAALAGLKLGAQVGTTSLTAVNDVIKPTAKASVFNTNDDAKLALANGTIDAIVVDLPTGLFLSAVGTADGGIDNGVLLGQLPGTGTAAEQFGLVLDKGSPLTACVTQAVDALRTDGTLAQLEKTWLTDTAGAPVLN